MTAPTALKMGTRYECSNRNAPGAGLVHDSGHGKPRRAKCSRCGSAFYTSTGRWGTFEWTGNGRYPLDQAKATFDREPAAERYAAKNDLVVRWLPESVFAPTPPPAHTEGWGHEAEHVVVAVRFLRAKHGAAPNYNMLVGAITLPDGVLCGCAVWKAEDLGLVTTYAHAFGGCKTAYVIPGEYETCTATRMQPQRVGPPITFDPCGVPLDDFGWCHLASLHERS